MKKSQILNQCTFVLVGFVFFACAPSTSIYDSSGNAQRDEWLDGKQKYCPTTRTPIFSSLPQQPISNSQSAESPIVDQGCAIEWRRSTGAVNPDSSRSALEPHSGTYSHQSYRPFDPVRARRADDASEHCELVCQSLSHDRSSWMFVALGLRTASTIAICIASEREMESRSARVRSAPISHIA
jgi:hypothetical protein